MKTFIFLTLVLVTALSCHKKQILDKAQRPFPQDIKYPASYIRPSSFSQDQLDNTLKNLYNEWKKRYIKQCPKGGYYVDFSDEDQNVSTVSEAIGYGMLIEAYMAGADASAKEIFDGLLRFYLSHQSNICHSFMAWRQGTNCQNTGFDSATDGDEDVAFALLLAYSQWGSDESYDYLSLAKKIINALKQCAFDRAGYPLLGDWVSESEMIYSSATRSSDWMPDHYMAFYKYTQDTFWTLATNRIIEISQSIQQNYSPQTGLIPDFIIHAGTVPIPAYPNFLESQYDGAQYYNACRTPWRLTTGYLFSDGANLHSIINKINKWIITKTGGNPENIMAGYTLDGSAVSNYQDIAFTGAYAVAAMAGGNRQWLDQCLSELVKPSTSDYTYYANTLRILYLLVISGNYWLP